MIRGLLDDPGGFSKQVGELRKQWCFNFGKSSHAAAEAVAGIASTAATLSMRFRQQGANDD